MVVFLAVLRMAHFRLTGVADTFLCIDLEPAIIDTAATNQLQYIPAPINEDTFEDVTRHIEGSLLCPRINQNMPEETLYTQTVIPLLFAYHAANKRTTAFSRVRSSLGSGTHATPDVQFCIFDDSEHARGSILYQTDIFDSKTIWSIARAFLVLLESGLDEPSSMVGLLPMITDHDTTILENMGLLGVNEETYSRDSSVIDVFRQGVISWPSRIAISDVTTELSYAQLDSLSSVVESWLSVQGLPAESIIGVLAGRACDTLVIFLGILKANMAYLPLDVHTPASRLGAIFSCLAGLRFVLVADAVQIPISEARDVEFIPFRNVLKHMGSQCPNSQPIQKGVRLPSAESLAYIMFTSGSTGMPKGVMIQHRGVVRLAQNSNMVKYMPYAPTMAHLSNIAFDASTWEIYASLLNGGTIVCVDSTTLLDSERLQSLFASKRIQVALFPTAIFREYLRESPSIFQNLELLCVGGERFDTRDLKLALQVMSGTLANAYGPTENTTMSTVYFVPKGVEFVNGLPIGRAISNSGALVMDSCQRLVPLGTLGELVVTGDGLARGYTDSCLNQGRFVSVIIKGKQHKAYRTGDIVRFRPKDGELEYFGRRDGQVKVRGHRVETREIEHTLRRHSAVREAAVVVQRGGDIVGCVTMHAEDGCGVRKHDNKDEHDQVEAWRQLYDETMYGSMDTMTRYQAGRDFIGWTSMYDGQPIDISEMNEWLDDTIETMLNGRKPGSVLEIGTGSGMILFNIIDGLEDYVGLDPSGSAINFINKTYPSFPALHCKVRMYKAAATELPFLDIPTTPGLVIFNSVVQHFPSQEYLFRVIKDVVQLRGSGIILFFGDIRSMALRQEFRVSRALHRLEGFVSKEEMRSQLSGEESELLIDPGFFTSLRTRLHGHVDHVEILPKRMIAVNELSCYRYAAVVYTKGAMKDVDLCPVPKESWIDYQRGRLTRQSILNMLQHSTQRRFLAISNIPNSRTIVERCCVDALRETDMDNDPVWISTARRAAQQYDSLSPVDLAELADEAGYRVEISWARQWALRGGFDAIFHHDPSSSGWNRRMFDFPTDHRGRALSTLSSQPIRQHRKNRVLGELRELVERHLPSYMAPREILILDRIPINSNGKIDRLYLAKMSQDRIPLGISVHQQPMTKQEHTMQHIWSQVLNSSIEMIGRDKDFFRLGGNSMSAMKVVGLARKAGFKLTVEDILRHKTVGSLASRVEFDPSKDPTKLEQPKLVDPAKSKEALHNFLGREPGIALASVVDIYPTTSIQDEFFYRPGAWREYYDYFFMDIDDGHLTTSEIEDNCTMTLERYPILRTCFFQSMGKNWQVVLDKLDCPLRVKETDGDLDEFCRRYIATDLETISETQPPAQVIEIRQTTNRTQRLMMRLQHAQYDAVSIPIIFESLVNGTNNAVASSEGEEPNFFHYMAYTAQTRSTAISYWKHLLQGSSLTRLQPLLRPRDAAQSKPRPLQAHASMSLPMLPEKSIMLASLVHAGWAVLLGRLTGVSDVVYWNSITGRNSALTGIESVVGPCISACPVRVPLASLDDVLSLLEWVQDQLLALGEADSLGKDIVEQCTDWPSGIFDSMLQHQSYGDCPKLWCFGADRPIRWAENPRLEEPYPWIATYTEDGLLHVRLYANTHLIKMEQATAIVESLCKVIQKLSQDLSLSVTNLLASCSVELRVPSRDE
ncbi:hypothetical protein FANTH_13450 [Fusarium anthophilum]|uniref:Carrier domain-containing protein n=1 Tax=Fusarium anthophilum TaxID=48485 RepID=A0A8H5DQ32_9HYPO|nr:hypothetical protein FANTH_13450 [Fusarium anthophilum]